MPDIAYRPVVPGIQYRDADRELQKRIVAKLNVPGRHRLSAATIHLEDGFTILAMKDDEPVGVISICWQALPEPLSRTMEAFIDLIDVDPAYRRQGLARGLVEQAALRATQDGAYQMRAWTSEDRPAALALWRALGFGLCPAVVAVGAQSALVSGCFAVRRLSG